MEHKEETDEADGSGTQHATTDVADKTGQRSQTETYHTSDSWHIFATSDEEDNATWRHEAFSKEFATTRESSKTNPK